MPQKKEVDTIPPPPVFFVGQGEQKPHKPKIATLVCPGCGDTTRVAEAVLYYGQMNNTAPPVCSGCGEIFCRVIGL